MTVLRGRVVIVKEGETQAVEAAEVRLSGIWRHAPQANRETPPAPPYLVRILPALSWERPQGGSITPIAFSLVDKPARYLLESAGPQSRQLRLSNVAGLAPGDLLAIDPQDPELLDFITVREAPNAIPGEPGRPGLVRLAPVEASHAEPGGAVASHSSLVRFHRSQAGVVKVVFEGEAGSAVQLAEPAYPGDGCLFLDDLAGLHASRMVQIAGGSYPPELHQLALYTARSGRDGYYRLPDLCGVAQVKLEASSAKRKPVQVVLSPDYDRPEYIVDFIFH